MDLKGQVESSSLGLEEAGGQEVMEDRDLSRIIVK